MKTLGLILLIGGIAFGFTRGLIHYKIGMEYESKISAFWDLADKSSTIEKKSQYIDKMVVAISLQGLSGYYNALFYPTEANGFDSNFQALKTLQLRLKEISKMNVSSFEYQTAIHQITEQEQGDAREMLSVIRGCWEKKNHYWYWNFPVCLTFLIIQVLMIGAGIIITVNYLLDN